MSSLFFGQRIQFDTKMKQPDEELSTEEKFGNEYYNHSGCIPLTLYIFYFE